MTLFERAQQVIPGGVNSPVRALQSLGIEPPFVASAKGAHFTTESGQEYLDFCMSWGALILGHTPEVVTTAVQEQLLKGTTYGIPTKGEVELAEKIVSMVPSIEQVRLVSSGTEATMSALRLARGFTGRSLIVKFDGCYHGHSDGLLVSAGSGVANLPNSFSAGVPQEIVSQTISIPYNDRAAIEKLFITRGVDIAAVIVEPVAGNMGLVVPDESWLCLLRQLTEKYDSVLIFDEVITGFRVAPGGAQEHFSIYPDLTCLGKIVGGGFPLAAFGGKREIMECLAPVGPVYQAGTLSGNPLAVTAGNALLGYLDTHRSLYYDLQLRTNHFVNEAKKRTSHHIAHIGSMFTLFHTATPVRNYATAQTQNLAHFKAFWHKAYASGIYLPPSAFETAFISTAHSDQHLEQVLNIL